MHVPIVTYSYGNKKYSLSDKKIFKKRVKITL